MGGLGSRFATAGFDTPKPLMLVDGMPMFMKALSSFDSFRGERLVTAIIRRELDEEFGLARQIHKASKAEVVVMPALTKGAVETCMAAASRIEADDGIVVLDCDLAFKSPDYITKVTHVLEDIDDVAGVLLTFPSQHPRYSYAAIEHGSVVRTAEKEVISNHAVAGSYFFASGSIFLSAAGQLLQSAPDSEYYSSQLYNIILGQGGRVAAISVESFASFGTPEELASYQRGTGL